MTSTNGNSSDTAVCLGTKTIRLRDRETGSKKEGLVAIFHSAAAAAATAAGADGDSEILRVAVTDGTAVYEGEIHMDRVKMKLLESLDHDKPQQTLLLAGYLLHDTIDQVEPVYTYNHDLDNGDDHVMLVIKYQHNTNSGENDEDAAMKKAWSGSLTRSNDLLQFYTTLGNCINQERRNMTQLQQEMEVVKKDRASWKETADQLSGKWETEKDTLFHNFATLYNRTRDELGTARTQLKDLQLQLDISQQEAQFNKSSNGKGRATKRAKKQISFQEKEQEMPEQPDDNDNIFHDDDVVNALAAGQRVDIKQSKKRAAPKAKKQKQTVKGESESDDEENQPKKKSTTKAPAFSIDSDSDDSVTKRIRAQIAAGGMNSSSDDDNDDGDGEGKPVRRAII